MERLNWLAIFLGETVWTGYILERPQLRLHCPNAKNSDNLGRRTDISYPDQIFAIATSKLVLHYG